MTVLLPDCTYCWAAEVARGGGRGGGGASTGGWGEPSKASSTPRLAVWSLPDSREDAASPKWSLGLFLSGFSCNVVLNMTVWLP